MTNKQQGTHINDALARLQRSVSVPPIDPAREQSLLAAFDAYWTRPSSPWWKAARHRGPNGAARSPRTARPSRRVWSVTAALVAITVALNWLVITNAPRTAAVEPDPVDDLAGFVPWPGSDAWPPFESGSLERVELPVSALRGLGLPDPVSTVSVVQADIIVGQDGFARAVRLVHQ